MKTRTNIKAGKWSRDNGSVTTAPMNHNESMKVRTSVKAGGRSVNHNEQLAKRLAPKAIVRNDNNVMKVKTNLKAGKRTEVKDSHD